MCKDLFVGFTRCCMHTTTRSTSLSSFFFEVRVVRKWVSCKKSSRPRKRSSPCCRCKNRDLRLRHKVERHCCRWSVQTTQVSSRIPVTTGMTLYIYICIYPFIFLTQLFFDFKTLHSCSGFVETNSQKFPRSVFRRSVASR